MRYCMKDHFPAMPERYSIWLDSNFNNSIIFYKNDFYNYASDIGTIEWCRTCKFTEEETLVWVLRFGDNMPLHKHDLQVDPML